MQGSEDPLVTLAEQRGEDVLAHLLTPEVIGAVTTRLSPRLVHETLYRHAK